MKDTTTIADISSNAATPSKRHKTSNEENKEFDPGRKKEKAPPSDAAVTLPSFSGEKLEGFLSVFYLCSFYALCVPVFKENWDAAVTLPSFSGEKLGGFLSVLYLCSFYALCVPVFKEKSEHTQTF